MTGRPLFEPRDVGDAAQPYGADYIRALLTALNGEAELQLERHDGNAYVTARSLQRYLSDAVPRFMERNSPNEKMLVPAAVIESSDDQWVARIPELMVPG